VAKKRPVTKKGKKPPLHKAGHKKQAKKPVGRKAPAGSGRRARKRTLKARKTQVQSGVAVPVTSSDFGRPEDEDQI
jgi:hypothetical protein